MSRTVFKIASAFRQPRLRVDTHESIEGYAGRFHQNRSNEAVLIALYKKPASLDTASSMIPGEGDLVLVGKKAPDSRMAGEFALLGGKIEKRDVEGSEKAIEVFENTLARELYEEAGLSAGDYACSYCSSFLDKQSGFTIHCFSGFLLSNPQADAQAQHLAHANLRPRDAEHESFCWMPVSRVFSSRQVASTAKRAIDFTLENW